MSHRIQFRRDTKSRWAEINPVLMEGEVGLEVDTQNIKMGDGSTAWNDLKYGVGYSNISQSTGDNENLVMSQKAITQELAKKAASTLINFPDYEDIISKTDSEGTSVLSFKDRSASTDTFVSKGYKILRKNVVTASDGTNKNILTSDMLNEANTIYEIRYDFDLDGETIEIPEECTLKFNGGKFSNGYIKFNKTYIEGGKRCFNKVLPTDGTLKNEEVEFDWFTPTTITLEQYKNRVNISSSNSKILKAIIDCFHDTTSIRFGKSIYIFEDEIIMNMSHGMEIRGYSTNETCLYFPESRGLHLHTGNFNSGTISDMFIHSKLECIYVYYQDANNRMNAINDCLFTRLQLLSESGKYCFGADIDYAAFMYHNSFKDVGVSGENGFSCIASLGTVFEGIYDLYQDFAHISLSSREDMSLFYNCSRVFLVNSNITYNRMGHIFKYIADSTHTDFGSWFIAKNCNFEGLTGEFIYTNDSNLLLLSVYIENCTWYSSQDGDAPIHFKIYRPGVLQGLPSTISGDNGSKVTSYNFGMSPVNLNISQDVDFKSDVTYKLIKSNCDAEVIDAYNFYDGSTYNRLFNTIHISAPKYNIIRNVSFIPADFDLTQKKSLNISGISTLPSVIRITKADKDNAIFTILDSRKATYPYGSVIPCGDIEILNNTNYAVTIHFEWLGTNLTLGSYIILPKNGYTYHVGPNIVLQKPCKLADNTMMHLTKGYRFEFGGVMYECLEPGCGIYCEGTLEDNQYIDAEIRLGGYGIKKKNGYIYAGTVKGTTSKLDDITQITNEFVNSGTAQLVCVGKCAIIARLSGTTTNRPSLENKYNDFQYFDTTLGKPIWWNGTKWVDATGTDV